MLETIARVIGEAVKAGQIATLRDVAPLLMRDCQLGQADALAVAEAVSRKWQDRFFPPISRIELFLTENCNLRCDYCFVEGKNALGSMSWDTARQAVDLLFRESRDQKDLSIFFMGGEPFLRFDVMRRVVEYATELGKAQGKHAKFSVTTNGTLLTEESLAFCAQHRMMILLSLDGAQETQDRHRKTAGGQGSFQMIMDRLPLMKRYQPWMGARMTVTPDAVGEIAANVRFLVEHGFNYFIIGPASGIDWLEDDLEVYEAQMRQVVDEHREALAKGTNLRIDLLRELENLRDKVGVWGCQAGRHSITVACNGDIHACSKMLGLNDLDGIYKLGDLARGITETGARAELIGMWAKRNTRCMTCELADSCSGGCFATNYAATGSIYDPCESECRVVARNLSIRRYASQVLGDAHGREDTEACTV